MNAEVSRASIPPVSAAVRIRTQTATNHRFEWCRRQHWRPHCGEHLRFAACLAAGDHQPANQPHPNTDHGTPTKRRAVIAPHDWPPPLRSASANGNPPPFTCTAADTPERVLRALLLQALFSVRSERHLMQRISYNMRLRLVGRCGDGRAGLGRHGVHPEPRSAAGSHIGDSFLATIPGGFADHTTALDRAFFGGWHVDRGLGVDEQLSPKGRQWLAPPLGPRALAGQDQSFCGIAVMFSLCSVSFPVKPGLVAPNLTCSLRSSYFLMYQ